MQRTPPEMKLAARALQNEATPVERRPRQALHDYRPRFTRQHVVSHYIIDIARRSLNIAFELDGGGHVEQVEADFARSAYLEQQRWTALRYWKNDVSNNLDGVYSTITEAVSRASTRSQPLPSRDGT